MTAHLPRQAWLALAPIVAILAFLAGRELRPDTAESFDYDLTAPGYQAAVPAPGLSKGGFTGFDGAALDGETVVSGRVTAVSPESLIVQTESAAVPIRLSGDRPLRRIGAATLSDVRPGMTVVVRTTPDQDEAAAILIVSTP